MSHYPERLADWGNSVKDRYEDTARTSRVTMATWRNHPMLLKSLAPDKYGGGKL